VCRCPREACGSGFLESGPAPLSGSATLLVVEDEHAFRELLREGLQSKGYQVLVASNGVEALQVAEQHPEAIRVLITDLIMPQMSGPELAKCLTKVRAISTCCICRVTATTKWGRSQVQMAN